MSADLDLRTTPARPDLAAKHLEGRVSAARFVGGTAQEVIVPLAPLRRRLDLSLPLDTELLMGERFTVYEVKDGWAWGQAELDSYVGYVPSDLLAAPSGEPTHRVTVPASRLYLGPDIKAVASERMSLGCRLHVAGHTVRFAEVSTRDGARYVPLAHVAPLGTRAADFVEVAERFTGVPYVWGGRSSLGLDCSGLVQLSLAEAGIVSPRDSDQQRDALGTLLGGPEALGSIQRGDLIFWTAHVAIAVDGRRIIHANATAMSVSMHEAISFARSVEPTVGPVLAVKRMSWLRAP